MHFLTPLQAGLIRLSHLKFNGYLMTQVLVVNIIFIAFFKFHPVRHSNAVLCIQFCLLLLVQSYCVALTFDVPSGRQYTQIQCWNPTYLDDGTRLYILFGNKVSAEYHKPYSYWQQFACLYQTYTLSALFPSSFFLISQNPTPDKP